MDSHGVPSARSYHKMAPAGVGPGATALVPSHDREEHNPTHYPRSDVRSMAAFAPCSTLDAIPGDASSSLSMKRKAVNVATSEPIVPLKIPRLPQTPSRPLAQRRRHGKPPPQPPYRLDFGQHSGKTLNEVPPSWLLWAIDQGIHQQHLDFSIALYELGRTTTLEHGGKVLKAEPHYHAPAKQASNSSSTSQWVVPDKDHASAYRFWASKLEAPAWITDQDAINWFQVNPFEMEKAGICPLSAADIENLGAPSGRVWWLYVVYKYAENHCTTRQQTARQMLDHFLDRNNIKFRGSGSMASRIGS